ncbi:hypothetical protein [Telluribacter sp.]|jgi:hypothetical protein|uniref:hypothetical protein n=1 Tax=Telluribacter sp. TaxID=1978767 RepID=UPI002E151582|nr:hypothetical protein [Telluribacter sp.]
MSSSISKEELIRIKGKFQAKYGFEMDEWTAVLMTEINEKFYQFNNEVQSSVQSIDKASRLIKGQIQPVYFCNTKEAFLYGLGKWLAPSVVGLVAVLITAYFVSQSQDYQEMNTLLNASPKARLFRQVIKESWVEEIRGRHYLVLKPQKSLSDTRAGLDCYYLKTDDAILMPLEPKK